MKIVVLRNTTTAKVSRESYFVEFEGGVLVKGLIAVLKEIFPKLRNLPIIERIYINLGIINVKLLNTPHQQNKIGICTISICSD